MTKLQKKGGIIFTSVDNTKRYANSTGTLSNDAMRFTTDYILKRQ